MRCHLWRLSWAAFAVALSVTGFFRVMRCRAPPEAPEAMTPASARLLAASPATLQHESDDRSLVRTLLVAFLRHFKVTKVAEGDLDLILAEEGWVESDGAALRKLLALAFGGRGAQTRGRPATMALQAEFSRVGKEMKTSVDGGDIPAETDELGCTMLMLSMAVALLRAPPQTAMVEYGTMMGFSTRCLAAGARLAFEAGASVGDAAFYAFDKFSYTPTYKSTWKTSGVAGREKWLRSGDNYRQQVQRHVEPYNVTLTKGTIGSRDADGRDFASSQFWGHRRLNLVAIDGGKDRMFWNKATSLVLPYMTTGSLLLPGDSLMRKTPKVICTQIGTILGALVKNQYVTLVHVACCTSHTVWMVRKQIPAELIAQFRFDSLSATEWDALWDEFTQQLKAILMEVYGTPMDERLEKALIWGRACTKGRPNRRPS